MVTKCNVIIIILDKSLLQRVDLSINITSKPKVLTNVSLTMKLKSHQLQHSKKPSEKLEQHVSFHMLKFVICEY